MQHAQRVMSALNLRLWTAVWCAAAVCARCRLLLPLVCRCTRASSVWAGYLSGRCAVVRQVCAAVCQECVAVCSAVAKHIFKAVSAAPALPVRVLTHTHTYTHRCPAPARLDTTAARTQRKCSSTAAAAASAAWHSTAAAIRDGRVVMAL